MDHILYEVLMRCLNIPYVWGGNHPLQGFDCSGLALWALKSVGLWNDGDTTAQGLYSHFKIAGTVLDSEHELPIGTLVFFGSSVSSITHVAIAFDSELMIEAGGGGSKTKTPADATKAGACVRVRPITSRRDLVALICPYRLQAASA